MKTRSLVLLSSLALTAGLAQAKLPPLSDEET